MVDTLWHILPPIDNIILSYILKHFNYFFNTISYIYIINFVYHNIFAKINAIIYILPYISCYFFHPTEYKKSYNSFLQRITAYFLFFVRFQPVNRLSEIGKAFFVFRNDVPFKVTVMKVERYIFYCHTVFGKFLYRILKKMHVVGFLMYLAVRRHQSVKYCKKFSICQAVIRIFFLWIRT